MPSHEIELAEGVDEYQYFLEKEWSDGLPVVAPTAARLAWMLKGTARDPDDIVGAIPPAGETATVRDVALHALMAGCKPEYLPVVLGALPGAAVLEHGGKRFEIRMRGAGTGTAPSGGDNNR